MPSNNLLLTVDNVLSTYKSRVHGEYALTKYKKYFPISSTVALSGIVADLMGDGHLQGTPKWRLDYCSNSIEELERFNLEFFNLFKVKGKIRACKTNKYGTMNLGINNKPCSRILFLLGVPIGSKVLKNFSVPKWILYNKHYFARFVNRLFCCEATVDTKYRFIEIKMNKEISKINSGISFLNEIKVYMKKYFSIDSTKVFLETRNNLRIDGLQTKSIRLKIKNNVSLKKYCKYIGFEDTAKQTKLIQIINY